MSTRSTLQILMAGIVLVGLLFYTAEPVYSSTPHVDTPNTEAPVKSGEVHEKTDEHHTKANTFAILGIPIEFIIFAITLICVGAFHHYVLPIALGGLSAVILSKFLFGLGFGSHHVTGITGLVGHVSHEWITIVNLLGLLIGFEILSEHFKDSRVPDILPKYLPKGFWGCFMLLFLVFIMSGFLDNIAAAMIGGSVAMTIFRGNVHIGYLASMVAASNAGGAGSVVGDTTTTMIWLSGKSPLLVIEAYLPAIISFGVFAVFGSMQQAKHQKIIYDPEEGLKIRWSYVGVVGFILALVVSTNVLANTYLPPDPKVGGESGPWLGMAVWAGILLMAPIAKPHWGSVPKAFKGTVFLLSLVLAASMMPVDKLPPATEWTTLAIGFISAIFDNIPLTKLALDQGGYDWGFLAYAVGFGGSMVWFGSSAGVALSNSFPQAKSVWNWMRHGWYVPVAYVIGYIGIVLIIGWKPDPIPVIEPEKIAEVKTEQTQNATFK